MFIIMMIRPKFSEALLLFRIIYARMSLEDIEQPFKEVFKEARNDGINLEYSIANPLFGHVFRATGCLENVRFFSSELKTEYDREMRDYGLDKSEDSLTNLLIHLFPSHMGTLNTLRGVNLNFTNRFFIENKDYKSGKGSRASSLEIRTENIKMLGETFIKLLRDGTSTEVEMPDPRSPHPYKLFEYYVFLSSNAPGLDDINLKLLAIHAYALDVINTVDELKAYLKPISDGLKEVGNVEHLVLDEEQEKLFNKLYAVSFKFPYSNTRQPASNTSIPIYHRKTKTFDPKERFSDCADIVILHLCNCLFYDVKAGECSLACLKPAGKTTSDECSELIGFYEKYHHKPFEITYEMRKDWSKVVQGLSSNKEFECKGGYKPYIIRYVKKVYCNELKSSIFNIMSVLSKICDGNSIFEDIMTSGEPISKGSIVRKFSDFLDKISTKNILSLIHITSIEEIELDGMKDFVGVFELTFIYKNNEMKMLLDIHDRHVKFNFLSEKYNQEKISLNMLKCLTSVDNKLLLSSLLNRYVNLLDGKNEKVKNSDSILEVLYNQGILQTNDQKKDQLIYLLEYIGDKNKNINYPLIKTIAGNIVRSTNLSDEATRSIFRPFFIYIEDLFGAMNHNEKIDTWLSLHKKYSAIKSKVVRSIWNDLIKDSPKEIDNLNLSSSLYEVGSIEVILSLAKKVLLRLGISLDKRDSSISNILFRAIRDFMVENSVLIELTFSGIDLEPGYLSEFANEVKNNTTLKELNIASNFILLDENLKCIADALKTNAALEILDISHNNLGPEVAKYFTETLKENKTLTTLTISSNRIGEKGAEYLAGAFREYKSFAMARIFNSWVMRALGIELIDCKFNNTLIALNISNNGLGAKGAKYIADAFKENKSLIKLNIASNELGAEGAEYIAGFLKENKFLKSLDISNSELGTDGVKHIAEALKANGSLATLDISLNSLIAGDMKYIAEALKINGSLTTLDISSNNSTAEDAEYIAEALKVNKSLISLVFSHNELKNEGLIHIAKGLEENKSLKTLNIANVKYGIEGIEYLLKAVEVNQTLKELIVFEYFLKEAIEKLRENAKRMDLALIVHGY